VASHVPSSLFYLVLIPYSHAQKQVAMGRNFLSRYPDDLYLMTIEKIIFFTPFDAVFGQLL
jgi:hypothetical protein